MNATDKRVRIGGACGFWGDSAMATPQLLQVPGLQYLVYDYLAETTMAILAKARAKDPTLGYATDFVQAVMTPHLLAIHERGIKVIANAGGLNPEGCRGALLQVAEKQGIALRVAVVTGDDLMPQMGTLQAQGLHTTADQPLPERPLSVNAYVGARGIAQALDAGADVVITGRCVDSAVVLGALVHEFGWSWQDWDRLSAGTLAGHLIECGAQATGGLFTDWQAVPDWANIGYPVIDVAPDGSLELSKPEGTGGLIHPGAVAEQILYEVGDPANYLMPDVGCDWRHVQVERTGHDTVKVSGARGLPAPTHYKANATWQDGYQLQLMLAIRGIDAPLKAERTAQALLTRSSAMMAAQGFGDYSETCVELLGGESHYGPHAQAHTAREVVLRIAVRHAQAKALAVLQRECASSGTSMGPGTRSSFSGRADIQPVIKLCSFMLPKTQVRLQMRLDDQLVDASDHAASAATQTTRTEATPPANPSLPENAHDNEPLHDCRLIDLAWARSGDKGDDENIGVIARHPKAWAWLRAQLQAAQVQAYFSHLVQGPVLRYEVPGLQALNFVLHQALGGGGVCSLRSDPLGKSFAQMLLDMPLRVPASVLANFQHDTPQKANTP
ncbi:acyclic terpene utilization AtuA family protein [Limnohabitans sp.]|uniref:acyclic terpene utilization AtuA family protein n=1 Tax=Limnohabitans sp. TaxID=1907725 RepID=UPI0025C64607|nr:acyclic terpene utilization AtuA family protein [Limnohabitans sp.]